MTTDPSRNDEPTEVIDVIAEPVTPAGDEPIAMSDTEIDVVGPVTTRVEPVTLTGPLEPPEPLPEPARRTVEISFTVPSVGQRLRQTGGNVFRAARGIRGRVLLGYVLLVAGALALSLLVVRQVLLVRTDSQIETALAQEIEELDVLATDGINPQTGEPFGSDAAAIFDTFLGRNVPASDEIFLTIVDGAPYLQTIGAPVDLTANARLVDRWATLEEPLRLDVGEGEAEARTLAVPLLREDGTVAGVFIVAIFPANQLAEVGQAVRVIGGVGLLVLLAAAIVALVLAGRVLRPVTELTSTARRVSDNDLTARFDVRGDDELAMLGTSFNDMLDRLERGFESQREVLDDVAHELRTPVTIIRGHLELLEDDPEDRAETISLCIDELDRMGRYVNELLLVASASRPDFLSPEPVDVGELAEGLFARVGALGERDWRLISAPRPGSLFVEADRDRLTQAVINLANNAVQHTEDGDRIDLSVVATADDVLFGVRDHGPGVAPEIREHLFSRFSRAAGSRSSRPEGTGLGLAIVAAVATAHRGDVTLDDPPGGGARFTVRIPRSAGDGPEDPT